MTRGYGLLIFDAYRPWYVTRIFWDATPADKHEFVADPAKGSRHNREAGSSRASGGTSTTGTGRAMPSRTRHSTSSADTYFNPDVQFRIR